MNGSDSIRLSELTAIINRTISHAFAFRTFWVVAEVTNHSFYSQKGFHYFDLVEKADRGSQILARMPAVAWSGGNIRIREFEKLTGQPFRNDIQVLVKVSVDYHPVYGLKLTLLEVDASFTMGAIEKQKQATIRRLLDENPQYIRLVGEKFITANNQLALPKVIQKIAVISSSASAGLQDFIHTVESNSFRYKFLIDNYYTVVQGEVQAEPVKNKFEEVVASGKQYDAVVLIRGGGAQTDLLLFDQYILGLAVAKFPIPVITGIGHQKNETIVDLMAHTATKTPTRAAEFIIAHNRAFEEKVVLCQKTVIIKSQQIVAINVQGLHNMQSSVLNKSRDLVVNYRNQLNRYNQFVINNSRQILFHNKRFLISLTSQLLSRPRILVNNRLQDLYHIIGNMKTFQVQYLKNKGSQLDHHTSLIGMMAPANILKKGFAIVKARGKIAVDAGEISVGDDISVILARTELGATVKSKNIYDETPI